MTHSSTPQGVPIEEVPEFDCSWSPSGVAGADVWAAGELDLASAPLLAQTLQEASAAARLLVLNLEEVTFIDCAGLAVVVSASLASRAGGGRLVIVSPSESVAALMAMTGALDDLDVAGATEGSPQDGQPAQRSNNPVNAMVLATRVMAVVDRRLWLHTDDGVVHRAWAPDPQRDLAPGRPIRLYLDEEGAINGWWDPISGLAVNQRHLHPGRLPSRGVPMVCQGRCGLVWQAPAAALLVEHDERCLTCAGPIAAG